METKKLKRLIGLLLITVGMFFCSGYYYSVGISIRVKFVMLAFALLGCAIINPRIPRHFRSENGSSIVLVIVTGAILSQIFNWKQNPILDTIYIVVTLISALSVTEAISFDEFAEWYKKTMVFITSSSIIVQLISNFGIRLPSGQFVNVNGVKYETFGIWAWFDGNTRMMGPFWEPGLFSSFILIALIFELCFSKKSINVFRCVVFSIGVIFTQSTAGYLLLALTIYIAFHMRRRIQIVWDILAIILVLIGIYFQDYISVFLNNANTDVFYKLAQDTMTGNTRLMSPQLCLQVFMEAPITGNGITLAITKYNQYRTNLRVDALTSTSAFYLAAFGIWGVAYTWGWIKSLLKMNGFSLIIRCLLVMLFILIINKEPHYNLMITYIVLLYFIRNSNNVDNSKITKDIGGEKYERI